MDMSAQADVICSSSACGCEQRCKLCESCHALHVQAHPDVPVVDNLEDIWLVNKLQQERKAKQRKLQQAE